MSNSRSSDIVTLSMIGIAILGGLVLWRISTRPQKTPPIPKQQALQRVSQPVSTPKYIAPEPEPELPPEKTDPIAQRGLGARVTQDEPHRARRVIELPKDLSLSEQIITLRGGEWQLRVTISLSSEDAHFVRRAAPLRGKLIEMLYFLVSHRVPESLRTPSGEDRLRNDLHTRYSNLLRTKNFELYFDSLSLEERETLFEDEEVMDR